MLHLRIRILSFVLLWAGLGFAISTFYPAYSDQVSVNPRPRMESMGGAGVGAKGDFDSAMINPAGLADLKDSKIEVLPLLIEVPFAVDELTTTLDFKDKLDSIDADTSLSKDTKDSRKRDALNEFINEVGTTAAMVRINISPSYTRKYMHFGLLTDVFVDPSLRLGGVLGNEVLNGGNSSGTVGLIFGGGYGFLDDTLQVGMTVKPLYRFALFTQQQVTLLDIMKGRNANGKIPDEIFGKEKTERKAYGVGVDLGVKYDIPYFKEEVAPSVGVTYQDIGDTKFIGDADLPSDIPQSISMGVAVHPDWSIFKNTVAFDLRSINREEDFLNKIHFGLETVIWNLLAIRAGISQGYLTGGVGVMLKFLDIDLFVASREAGHYANIQPLRTLGFKFALGW